MDFFFGRLKLCVQCCADSQVANVDRSDALGLKWMELGIACEGRD